MMHFMMTHFKGMMTAAMGMKYLFPSSNKGEKYEYEIIMADQPHHPPPIYVSKELTFFF